MDRLRTLGLEVFAWNKRFSHGLLLDVAFPLAGGGGSWKGSKASLPSPSLPHPRRCSGSPSLGSCH